MIGKNSGIHEQAQETDSILIQMSNPLWVKEFSSYVEKKLNCKSRLSDLSEDELHDYIKKAVKKLNVKEFI